MCMTALRCTTNAGCAVLECTCGQQSHAGPLPSKGALLCYAAIQRLTMPAKWPKRSKGPCFSSCDTCGHHIACSSSEFHLVTTSSFCPCLVTAGNDRCGVCACVQPMLLARQLKQPAQHLPLKGLSPQQQSQVLSQYNHDQQRATAPLSAMVRHHLSHQNQRQGP